MFNVKLLKAELLMKGITNDEFARLLCINKSTLSKKINGKSDWTLSELRKTGEILGVDKLNEIFFDLEVS